MRHGGGTAAGAASCASSVCHTKLSTNEILNVRAAEQRVRSTNPLPHNGIVTGRVEGRRVEEVGICAQQEECRRGIVVCGGMKLEEGRQ